MAEAYYSQDRAAYGYQLSTLPGNQATDLHSHLGPPSSVTFFFSLCVGLQQAQLYMFEWTRLHHAHEMVRNPSWQGALERCGSVDCSCKYE